MTLILSAVVRDYAIQVSDRRLTRAGKLEDDATNKAVLFCNRFCFAYTGLGFIGVTPTDEWLTKALVNAKTPSLSGATRSLAQQATDAFRKIGWSRAEKRHAFVGVGWAQLPNEAFLSPIICSVSNAHNADGLWLDKARDEFTVFHRLWSDKPIFDVIATGQALQSKELKDLRRNLRRCFDHKTGPEPISGYLIDQIRRIATKNDLVGKHLMVVCLPKQSVPTSSWFLTNLAPGSQKTMKDVQSFYYLREGQDNRVGFGPDTACAGQGFTNVELEKLNESGSDASITVKIVLPDEKRI